jgi:DNA ligase-associated metallophosphoesterase
MPHHIELAGESVTLCPERALYWAREKTLFIADAHFGKAATFRARGVFVPHGTTADNLERLDSLIDRWQPARIIFLGDFFHARESQNASTLLSLAAWRERHSELQLSLVLGNHDRHSGPPPPELEVEVLEESSTLGPFALRHHPDPVAGRYVLCGHLHPGYRLSGRAHDHARVPCFWLGEDVGVLPAFGAFTGALIVTAAERDRIFLAGPDRVRPIRAVTSLG